MSQSLSFQRIEELLISREYYLDISLGDAAFRAALDTASADLWLASSACTTSACDALPKYQLGYMSPTFVSINNNQTAFNISFADTTSASEWFNPIQAET